MIVHTAIYGRVHGKLNGSTLNTSTMKKFFLFAFGCSLMLFACNGSSTEQTEEESAVESTAEETEAAMEVDSLADSLQQAVADTMQNDSVE